MLPGDEILLTCNETELLWMTRVQGLPLIKMGLPHERLVEIVAGDVPREEEIAGTNFTRGKLEHWITSHIQSVRGQLPGCDGKCRSFLCTEGKHMSCYLPNELIVL